MNTHIRPNAAVYCPKYILICQSSAFARRVFYGLFALFLVFFCPAIKGGTTSNQKRPLTTVDDEDHSFGHRKSFHCRHLVVEGRQVPGTPGQHLTAGDDQTGQIHRTIH